MWKEGCKWIVSIWKGGHDRLKLSTKNPFPLLECTARPYFPGYICRRTVTRVSSSQKNVSESDVSHFKAKMVICPILASFLFCCLDIDNDELLDPGE